MTQNIDLMMALFGWAPAPLSVRLRLAKGAGHKYVKRVPYVDAKGKRRYRYFYHVGHGLGVHHEDHMVEGAAFQVEGGHYHVTSVKGDKVTIRHDETGDVTTMSRKDLGAMLKRHHAEHLEKYGEKLKQLHADSKDGSHAQKRWAKRLKHFGHEAPSKDDEKPEKGGLSAAEEDQRKKAAEESARKRKKAKEPEKLGPHPRVAKVISNADRIVSRMKPGAAYSGIAGIEHKLTEDERKQLMAALEERHPNILFKEREAPGGKGVSVLAKVLTDEAKAKEDKRKERAAARLKTHAARDELKRRGPELEREQKKSREYAEKLKSQGLDNARARRQGWTEADLKQRIDAATEKMNAASAELERLTAAAEKEKAAEKAAKKAGEAEKPAAAKPAPKPAKGGGVTGRETTVFVADAGGKPKRQKARYRLVEASQAIASHDPTKGFAKNEAYPEGVQERAYHRDKDHQNVVRENARDLHAELVINTNPDAANGPPLVTEDGIVLGGNSRTMAIQMAHEQGGESSKRYIEHLKEQASHFGISADDVAKMKAPMLIREVEADKGDHSKLVRRYNEAFTQGMDPRVEQVARARLVSDGMLQELGQAMSEKTRSGDARYPTMGAYLNSKASKGLIESMERAGVIDRRNRAALMRKDGTLNEDGRRYVERLMVGKVLPDPDLLSDMKPSHLSAVARAVPHIIRAEKTGHKLSPHLKEALEVMNYMDRHGIEDVEGLSDQGDFASYAARGGGDTAGFTKAPEPGPEAAAMIKLMTEHSGPVQMAAAFRRLAGHAEKNPANQGDLLGGGAPRKSTHEIITDARTLKKGEGAVAAVTRWLRKSATVYHGPRGGKYLDPAHKIPYREGGQSDWVGHRGADPKRQEAAKAALSEWKGAHAEWSKLRNSAICAANSPECRQAYQRMYNSLHKLGRALNLDPQKAGGDYAKAAARWLKERGHTAATVSDRRAKPKTGGSQMALFRGGRFSYFAAMTGASQR